MSLISPSNLDTINAGEQGFQTKHNDNMFLLNNVLLHLKNLLDVDKTYLLDKMFTFYDESNSKFIFVYFNGDNFNIEISEDFSISLKKNGITKEEILPSRGTTALRSRVLVKSEMFFNTEKQIMEFFDNKNWKKYKSIYTGNTAGRPAYNIGDDEGLYFDTEAGKIYWFNHFQWIDKTSDFNSGNTANKPSSPVKNELYFNTETNFIEIYDGSNWIEFVIMVLGNTSNIPDSTTLTEKTFYFDYEAEKILYTDGTGGTWVDKTSDFYIGITEEKPFIPKIGECYFDTDLGIPIWYDGTNWIDATGTTV